MVLVPSFYNGGPRNETQVIKIGGKCHYLLSHQSEPTFNGVEVSHGLI